MNNLCTFLPQDKVKAFADLKPNEILRETERAVGGEEMYQTHIALMEMFANSKSVESRMETLKSQIESLQDQNKAVEAEKDRFLEIKKAKNELEMLKNFYKVVAYYGAHEDHVIAKKKMILKQKVLAEITQKVKQVEEKRKGAQKERNRVLGYVQRAQSHARDSKRGATTLMRQSNMSTLDERIEDALVELEQVGVAKEKLETKLVRQKTQLVSKQKELDKFENLDDVDAQITALKKEERKVEKVVSQIDQKIKSLKREIKKTQSRIRAETNSLEDITDTESRKRKVLSSYDRSGVRPELTFFFCKHRRFSCTSSSYIFPFEYFNLKRQTQILRKSHEWLGTQKFDKPVLGPVLTEIGCKSALHGQWIENCVGNRFKELFVAQTRRDFIKLQSKNKKTRGGSMNISLVEKTGNVHRSFTAAQMKDLKSFGIMGTLDQILVASAPIMQALCTQLGIQNILVGDATADSKFDALCKRLRETSASFKGCRILTPKTSYYIRVSKYVPLCRVRINCCSPLLCSPPSNDCKHVKLEC